MSTEFHAEVTDIREHSRRDGRILWQITLSQTCFAPGSTGSLTATARSGATLSVPVLSVEDDAGERWHATEKPLMAGTPVLARVD